MPESHDPQLILIGGTDALQLEEGGKVYRIGDPMPKNLSNARRLSLQAAGVRFETRHHEPVLTPDGKPATLAAAEQIDGPAVIAGVEDMPAAEAGSDQSRRATRKA